ncbi:hypothetical protein [Tunturiibacter gelidiferens]|uniref:hypothetical protein n=1 Tax=Tunturiibacter gelidiferens TaxID=3069689 RepID=UPI003D9AF73D
MSTLTDQLKANLPAIKSSVLHAETAIKTASVTIISGAALTTHQFLTSAEHIEDLFTPAGLLKIKHNLIYGGMLSVFGLFVPSPIKNLSVPPAK